MIQALKKLINRIFTNPRKSGLNDVARILDSEFGSSRGTPIDRALIEGFLESAIPKLSEHSTVLEFSELFFADKYCPTSNKSIFNFEPGNQVVVMDQSSVSGDLLIGPSRDFEKVDLIIATQLLAFTSNPFKSATSLLDMLKTEGMIIGTEPFCSPVSKYDDDRWGDYFRFTEKGLKSIYSSIEEKDLDIEIFPLGNWTTTYGLFKGFCTEDNIEYDVKSDPRTATNIGYIVRLKK
jgi:hypothetical protein